MPLLVALYLYVYGDGMVLFEDVDAFQVTMWCSYCALLTVWFLLTLSVMKRAFILWHILPTTGYLKGTRDQVQSESVINAIKLNYQDLARYPVIEKIVENKFGPDIAVLVLLYFSEIVLDETAEPLS